MDVLNTLSVRAQKRFQRQPARKIITTPSESYDELLERAQKERDFTDFNIGDRGFAFTTLGGQLRVSYITRGGRTRRIIRPLNPDN